MPILKQLFKLNLPIAPKPFQRCDGDYTEIHLGDHWAESKFRWWSVPPKGWEELNLLTIELLGLVEYRDDSVYFNEG